ncbi:hypothetical protein Tco_1104708 [Tanacetum coccineum]
MDLFFKNTLAQELREWGLDSASSSVHDKLGQSERDRFSIQNKDEINAAPRSANALHVVIPVNSHGIRNRPGSLSFFGNLLRMTAEQFSFKGVLANSLNFSLFPIKNWSNNRGTLGLDLDYGVELETTGGVSQNTASLALSCSVHIFQNLFVDTPCVLRSRYFLDENVLIICMRILKLEGGKPEVEFDLRTEVDNQN